MFKAIIPFIDKCSYFDHLKIMAQVFALLKANCHALFDDFVLESEKSIFKNIFEFVQHFLPYFWVFLDEKNEFMGFCYLYGVKEAENQLKSAFITVCFKRKFFNKAVRNVAFDFVPMLFHKYKFDKLKAECFSSNPSATRLLKDLNFKFKVRFENETVVCGKKVDLNIFELEKKDLKP